MEHAISALNSLPSAALLFEVRTGCVLHANRAALSLLGQSFGVSDIDSQRLTMLPGADLTELLKKGGSSARPLVRADLIVKTAYGSILPLSGWLYYPFNDPAMLSSDTAMLIFLPLTELPSNIRRAVRAIKMTAEDHHEDDISELSDQIFLSQIMDAFPGMVFIKDTNGRYVTCSEQFAKFVRLDSPEAIKGKTNREVLPQVSADWSTRLDNLMYEKQRSTSEIYPFAMENGLPVNWQRVSRTPLRSPDGKLIGLVGTLESVGNVMSLTEELTRMKAKFSALSEVMTYNSFVLVLWEADTLEINYLSDSIAYLGFKAAHFTCLNDWAELVHPDDRAEFDKQRKPLTKKQLNVDFWQEYRIVSQRGDVRWMYEHVTSSMSPGSHLYRSIIIDTTARHEHEVLNDNAVTVGQEMAALQIGNIHLLDIVSREYLQERCDRVEQALGLTSSIIDTVGEPLTDKKGICELCGMIRRSERGSTLCHLSDVNIGIAAHNAGGLVVEPCETLGFYVAAAPILVGDKHLGTWIVGRVRAGGLVSEDNVRSLFGRIDGDADAAVRAFESMPEWDMDEITQIFSLLPPYVQELSDFAHRSYMLMYETEKIFKSHEVLNRSSGMDSALTDLYRILFQVERDAESRLEDASQVLCDYHGFSRVVIVERLGRQYGISYQWRRSGIPPVNATVFTHSDLRTLSSLSAASNTVTQIPVREVPEPWRSMCSEAGSDSLLFRPIESNGRPTAMALFMQGRDRRPLHRDDLSFLDQMLAPMTAFIMMQQSERRMNQTTSSLQLVINSMRSAVYVIDRHNYEVLFANDHFDGQSITGSRGLACFRLLGLSSPCACCALDMLKDKPDGFTYTYETNERIPGCWHSVTMTSIFWTDNRPVYLIRIRDITEEKHRQEQLMHAATFDMLLDIPTIGRLSARLDNLMRLPVSSGFLFAIDIDNLRLINNTYGHTYGDALLKEIVSYLKGLTPDGEHVYRYSTSTLAVLYENASREAADGFMDKLYDRFSHSWRIADKHCFATFSAAMVEYPGDSGRVLDIMRDIDLSLELAIDRARNSFYTPTKREHLEHADRLSLANDLHRMVEDGCKDMVIHYQPVYDFSQGRVTHCEAFMRWNHPERGLIQPAGFLDIAEHTALIIPLSEALIDQVIKQCVQWTDMGLDIGVSVNFSAAHSRQEGLVEAIGEKLKAAGLPPSKLQLEFSEDLTISDREFTLRFIRELRELGCVVAIDNFATGLSTLGSMDINPVDVIKIDRDFVSDICENAYHAAVISFAVNAASICGMQVTCKGIENTQQLDKVREMGVNRMQGFLLSRPLPADALAELLKSSDTLQF